MNELSLLWYISLKDDPLLTLLLYYPVWVLPQWTGDLSELPAGS